MKRKKTSYYDDGRGGRLSAWMLRRANRQRKLEVMKAWFHKHYEDPVEGCPYESSSGGYQYIYGGPYDAHDELSSEFGGLVQDSLIEELADELSNITTDWSGSSDNLAFDDYIYQSLELTSSAYDALGVALKELSELLDAKLNENLRYQLNKACFASAISAMEAYLADFFIANVRNNSELMKTLVRTSPEFMNKKIAFSEIHAEWGKLEKTGRDTLHKF